MHVPLPIDAPDEVREEERFDAERLRPFLAAALPGAPGPIEVLQFRKGHSNLTYLVRIGDREAVLRRAPFGVQVKSAHDMRREFTILSALQGVYARAAAPPPGVQFTPELLRAISTALVDNLADLHAVDFARAGLGSIGRPEGYVARQVTGWTERYAKAKTDEVPEIETTAAWLARNLPKESGAAVIHNDYKYDNVVLDPADLSRIVAVLDWEMATVGDPLMDLGTVLAYWSEPDEPEEMRTRSYGPTFLPGSLSRIGLVRRYEERTGRAVGAALFYYVFALFKNAVIVQQIYKRYVQGHTRDPRFATLIGWVRVLALQAARAMERGRIDRLGRSS